MNNSIENLVKWKMKSSIYKKINRFSELHFIGVLQKRFYEKFNKTGGKALVLESLFNSFKTEFLLYRNQSKSMDWFLRNRDFRHERVNEVAGLQLFSKTTLGNCF